MFCAVWYSGRRKSWVHTEEDWEESAEGVRVRREVRMRRRRIFLRFWREEWSVSLTLGGAVAEDFSVLLVEEVVLAVIDVVVVDGVVEMGAIVVGGVGLLEVCILNRTTSGGGSRLETRQDGGERIKVEILRIGWGRRFRVCGDGDDDDAPSQKVDLEASAAVVAFERRSLSLIVS